MILSRRREVSYEQEAMILSRRREGSCEHEAMILSRRREGSCEQPIESPRNRGCIKRAPVSAPSLLLVTSVSLMHLI